MTFAVIGSVVPGAVSTRKDVPAVAWLVRIRARASGHPLYGETTDDVIAPTTLPIRFER